MAYYKDNLDNDEKSLAYDARQTYAQIIDYHLKKMVITRDSHDFPKYFDILEQLWAWMKHKLKNSNDNTDYLNLYNNACEVTKKYKSVYFGTSKDAEGVYEIKKCLEAIQMFLLRRADEENIFGNKWDDEGL